MYRQKTAKRQHDLGSVVLFIESFQKSIFSAMRAFSLTEFLTNTSTVKMSMYVWEHICQTFHFELLQSVQIGKGENVRKRRERIKPNVNASFFAREAEKNKRHQFCNTQYESK